MRRKGIGSALVLASQEWGSEHGFRKADIGDAVEKSPGGHDGAQAGV